MVHSMQIRLFDTPVLEFSVSKNRDVFEITNINVIEDQALLPHGLKPEPEGVYTWLSTRALPFNRRYADKLCVAMGIRPGDIERIIEVSLGLSLNDSYWVVPAGFEGSYREYNLYENGFSEVLAVIAYTGVVDTSAIPQHGLTPELTTNGTLHKAWRIAGGERLLYKGSTYGYKPGEWLSECLAAQIAQEFGLDNVPYWHEEWNQEDCSVCKCFCNKELSYVPFAVLTGKASMASCVGYAAQLGIKELDKLFDMIVFDALICNTDRHFTNYGYLIDAASNRVLGLAPVFDNGRGLFPNYAEQEVRDANMLASYMRPAFGPDSFEELAGRIIGKSQQEKLLHVANNLELVAPTSQYELRCELLSSFLRDRAKLLADLPPVDPESFLNLRVQ